MQLAGPFKNFIEKAKGVLKIDSANDRHFRSSLLFFFKRITLACFFFLLFFCRGFQHWVQAVMDKKHNWTVHIIELLLYKLPYALQLLAMQLYLPVILIKPLLNAAPLFTLLPFWDSFCCMVSIIMGYCSMVAMGFVVDGITIKDWNTLQASWKGPIKV